MAIISVFTAIVGVLATQAACNALAQPYDFNAYSNMLSVAPFHSPCDIPSMAFFDVPIYQQMNSLAERYRFRTGDVAEWYTLIQRLCPSYTSMDLYDGIATQFQSEMYARNIPYMPPPMHCNPLAQSTSYGSPVLPQGVSSSMNTSPYDLSYRNAYAMLDRSISQLSYGTENSIRQLLNRYLPSECLSKNPLIANQIATNMRYNLGMAEKHTSDYYYPFY